jgi:hypothetical protein
MAHIANIEHHTGSALQSIKNIAVKVNETTWFLLTFILFLIMGPFSAIAVVIGLFSLSNEETRARMIEPESI